VSGTPSFGFPAGTGQPKLRSPNTEQRLD
jgi:hypothetical protein